MAKVRRSPLDGLVALTVSQGVSTQIALIRSSFILFKQISDRKDDGQER